MKPSTTATIDCPHCGAHLPVRARVCTFCNANLEKVPRPDGIKARPDSRDVLTWQEVAYIVVSVLLVLTGAYDFVAGVIWVTPDSGGALVGIFGAIQVAIGIGLLFQQSWAQFVMRWLAILNVLYAVSHLIGGLVFLNFVGGQTTQAHSMGIGIALYSLLRAALSGAILYLIYVVGED